MQAIQRQNNQGSHQRSHGEQIKRDFAPFICFFIFIFELFLPTTTSLQLGFRNSSVSVCAVIVTVFPHVIRCDVLSTVITRLNVTRVLLVHSRLRLFFSQSHFLICIVSIIANCLIISQFTRVTILDTTINRFCVFSVLIRHIFVNN